MSRLSAHKLEIEVRRYKAIPVKEGICKKCNDYLVEDEFHFLLVCKKFKEQRCNLFNIIKNFYTDFELKSDNDKFMIIMASLNSDIINASMNFVFSCLC